ncbi:MAG: hypothetical protein HWD58_10645 [Bacteroidota bacterium]|nr:MAG: hypothetical protein HWD58_10645 [Bacteroidota bacterium]
MAQTEFRVMPNMVYCTLRDSRGLIWLGTQNGLALYQGDHLISYPVGQDSLHRMVKGTIYALQEDSEGRIWVASYTTGITVFHPIKIPTKTLHQAVILPTARSIPCNAKLGRCKSIRAMVLCFVI